MAKTAAKKRKKILLELPMPVEVPITLADKLIACVPDTWLDSLLTGPTAVVRSDGDFACPDIEALCRGIRERMRKVAECHPKDSPGVSEK